MLRPKKVVLVLSRLTSTHFGNTQTCHTIRDASGRIASESFAILAKKSLCFAGVGDGVHADKLW